MTSYADNSTWEEKMQIRTPGDLGAMIRDRRRKLGLDQRSLAEKAGVSRQWIVEVEKGKPRAEIGLLLRTIAVLGISLAADKAIAASTKPVVNIDSIIASARTKRP
jgi:HTH-type transcriptional regulator / antitoxin HipB